MPQQKKSPEQVTAERIALHAKCEIRGSHATVIDLSLATMLGGSASVTISLETRSFGGYGFNPQGWTSLHVNSATAAMHTLTCVAETIWNVLHTPKA